LSENSKLKERIEELEEVLPISPVKPPVRAIDENALIKPYLDEIAQLRAQLSEYVSIRFRLGHLIVRKIPMQLVLCVSHAAIPLTKP
jgi:hypothetical protein